MAGKKAKALGDYLQTLREEAGYSSKTALARKLEISTSHLSYLENGKRLISQRLIDKYKTHLCLKDDQFQQLIALYREALNEAAGSLEVAGVAKTDSANLDTELASESNNPQALHTTGKWFTKQRTLLIGAGVIFVLVLLIIPEFGRVVSTSTRTPTVTLSPTALPTLTSTLQLTTVSTTSLTVSPTPTPTEIFVCGETSRMTVSVPPFVRHQGITAFTFENTQGAVLNSHVRAVAIDSRGLWIGYFATAQNPSDGIGHYNRKSWADCNLFDAIAGKDVNSIAFDHSGNLWAATDKNGVAVWNGKNWQTYDTRNGLPHNQAFTITVDDQNNVWVGTWGGIARFDGVNWSIPYTVSNDTIYNDHVHAIAFDKTGNIWVGHVSDGISEYQASDGKWVEHTAEEGLIGADAVRSIVVRPGDSTSPESVWIATDGGGVSKYEQGNWTPYRVKDGLPSDNVIALAIDPYKRVWAATTGGVAYFDGSRWILYDTISTLSIAFGVKCPDQTCVIDNDHVWMGTESMGVTQSRIPWPDVALDILEVCFVKVVDEARQRYCQTISDSTSEQITALYSQVLSPGEKFWVEVKVSPRSPHQLKQGRGDFLAYTEEDDTNLFGSNDRMPIVSGTIESGQPYTFTNPDTPFVAPSLSDSVQEQIFTSTWRVWMWTRYVGPYIQLKFTVRKP